MTGNMTETLRRLNPEVRGVLVQALENEIRKEIADDQDSPNRAGR